MTSDAPTYRSNPAHDAERVAIGIVKHWLGGRGTLLDASASSAVFDFTIDYADGRRAVGDVWLDADAKLMAVWGDLFAQERHHVVQLTPNSGTWTVGLTREARGRDVRRGLPALIDGCLAADVTRLEIERSWLPASAPDALHSIVDRCRSLGLARLGRIDNAQSPPRAEATGSAPAHDVAYYFPGSEPGAAADDPATVKDWIDRVFADPAGIKHVTGKLLPASADERHAVVVASTRTSSVIEMRLERLPVDEPDLVVPDGLTHVWVLPRYVRSGSAPFVRLWTAEDGWSVVRA
ncbi:MAG: hypothetical protein M0Z51_06615 [Propionibacterium sp.]|nr:hypothetical protein [Propionibacterium sp.]